MMPLSSNFIFHLVQSAARRGSTPVLSAYDPKGDSNTDSIAKMAPLSSYAITRASKMSPNKAELAIWKMATGKKGPFSSADLARAVGISLSDLSTAAQAVSKLPLIKRRQHSHVVTYHFDRVTMIKHTYGVSPTLVKSSSGAFMIRDLIWRASLDWTRNSTDPLLS